MTPEDLRKRLAGQWLREAAKDLNAARLLAGAEPSRSVFHSQQAAEKAAKAFLCFHEIPFRKTHDIGDLGVECCRIDPTLTAVLQEAAELTDYASAFRYPDAPYEPEPEEAERAVRTAELLAEAVRVRLKIGEEPAGQVNT